MMFCVFDPGQVWWVVVEVAVMLAVAEVLEVVEVAEVVDVLVCA